MLRVRQHHRLTDGDLAAILCEQSLSYAKEPSQSNCGAGLRQKCWFWGGRRPRGVGGLCAAGRRSRSVRRLVTNPICGSIYRSRSTRSSRRLERSSELVALILQRGNVSSVSELRPETLFPAGNIRKFRLRNIGKHWETFSYWKHSSSAPWTTLGRPQTTPDDLGRTERTTWTTWTTPAGRQQCVAAHSQKNGWASIPEEIPMAHW